MVLNQQNYDLLVDHIAKSTMQTYSSDWQQFCKFCGDLKVEPVTCLVAVLVRYFRLWSEEGASYSTLNIVRSGISKYNCTGPDLLPIGEHPMVKQVMKAAFRSNPHIPKYCSTFNISPVLSYMEDMGPCESLDLKALTYMTLCLVAFSTLSRYVILATFD